MHAQAVAGHRSTVEGATTADGLEPTGDVTDRLAEVAEVAGRLNDEARNEGATVTAIVEEALELVAGADHVSLTVNTRGGHTTLATTSDLAAELDAAQYRLGQGPCVAAVDTGEWFRSGDLERDERWPQWSAVAAEQGIRSILGIRLLSQGEPFGALNLYGAGRDAFADDDEVELALLYAVHATGALNAARHATHLETALSSRHDIGVAQGILMGRYDLTAEQAFGAMERISSEQNIKLRELARRIVGAGGFPRQEE